jgi:hypothetical protein
MTRGNLTLALLLMPPASGVAKEPDIHGHWSGTFSSRHFHIAPFTLDLDIDVAKWPGTAGVSLGT